VAIFTYDLPEATENFKQANCPLFTLTDYDLLIKKALENNFIQESAMKSLIQWRENPKAWGSDK